MINLQAQQDRELRDSLKAGRFLQTYLDKYIMKMTPNKEWDNMIHPSYLNWDKAPEVQVDNLIRKGSQRLGINAHRNFRLGDLLHNDVQDALETTTEFVAEVGYFSQKWLFAGTCDGIMNHPRLGSGVIEFKSYSSLQRDKTGGERLQKKLKQPAILEAVNMNWIEDKDWVEILERCLNKERVVEPTPEHLTQLFTYVWIFNKTGGKGYQKQENGVIEIDFGIPKWAMLCYIGKEGFETKEFFYQIKKHSELVEKAEQNYKRVYKEMKKRGY